MPAAAQAPPQQQEPAQAQLTAAVIAALASAVTVAAVVAALRVLFRAAAIGTAALTAVAGLILSWPPDVIEGIGPATRWAVRTNSLRRATFFVHACQRVQGAAVSARSQGQPVKDAIDAAIAEERKYLAQHVVACQMRMAAASRVDGLAAEQGNLLGWNTVKDSRTTAECYAADRKNFYADRPPIIGYPGATHPNCRCYPSKPFRDAPILP